LSAFLSAPVDGTWTVKVVDTAAEDTGSLRAVSLRITGFVTD
jgi:subtilisin-like proprotein convertase family protein